LVIPWWVLYKFRDDCGERTHLENAERIDHPRLGEGQNSWGNFNQKKLPIPADFLGYDHASSLVCGDPATMSVESGLNFWLLFINLGSQDERIAYLLNN
jgi:hypothetical protein